MKTSGIVYFFFVAGLVILTSCASTSKISSDLEKNLVPATDSIMGDLDRSTIQFYSGKKDAILLWYNMPIEKTVDENGSIIEKTQAPQRLYIPARTPGILVEGNQSSSGVMKISFDKKKKNEKDSIPNYSFSPPDKKNISRNKFEGYTLSGDDGIYKKFMGALYSIMASTELWVDLRQIKYLKDHISRGNKIGKTKK